MEVVERPHRAVFFQILVFVYFFQVNIFLPFYIAACQCYIAPVCVNDVASLCNYIVYVFMYVYQFFFLFFSAV